MRNNDIKRILVYRCGQLGDTLVALPSMWVLRENFPDAEITLLHDNHGGKGYVSARSILEETGIFDKFVDYDPAIFSRFKLPNVWQTFELLLRLRKGFYNTMVYLAPSRRQRSTVTRDILFFSFLVGIHKIIGRRYFPTFPVKEEGYPLSQLQSEVDLLLERLRSSGLQISSASCARMDLNLGKLEFEAVEKWINNLPFDKGREWIGVGPGSKMPAKVWPSERFRDVVANLIDEFDIWPVIFGGSEDHAIGSELLHQWGRGYNAAGTLGVREAAAAIMRAKIYVGNDTGTMHLAAANAVPCVAIFTARDAPGHFYPYGQGHIVHRKVVECEGCMLEECVANDMKCIKSITVEEVTASCRALMSALKRP